MNRAGERSIHHINIVNCDIFASHSFAARQFSSPFCLIYSGNMAKARCDTPLRLRRFLFLAQKMAVLSHFADSIPE
jgi:hypothetical protein